MGVNKVILIGNLGKDPEMRVTTSQMPVTSFSLATGERKKDQSGTWVDRTEWHNIIAFGKTAENCSNYLKKGRQVYVEGKIQTRKWQDKEGKDRYTTEIIANTVQFIGSKEGGGKGGYQDSGFDEGPSNSGKEVVNSLPTADSMAGAGSFDDDDIPF